MTSSVKWRDPLERLTNLDPVPVSVQLFAMRCGPLLDQPKRGPRPQTARQDLSVERESGLLALMLGVEVSHPVLTIKHADDDAKEYRNNRNVLTPPPDVTQVPDRSGFVCEPQRLQAPPKPQCPLPERTMADS